MGLIERVKNEQFEKLIRESECSEELAAARADRLNERAELIDSTIKAFADSLDEELVTLTSGRMLPRYYLLGDVVLMVQYFLVQPINIDEPVDIKVLWDYCTYLVALDGDSHLVNTKIGALKLLNYEGLARTITEVPVHYTFEAEYVRKALGYADIC